MSNLDTLEVDIDFGEDELDYDTIETPHNNADQPSGEMHQDTESNKQQLLSDLYQSLDVDPTDERYRFNCRRYQRIECSGCITPILAREQCSEYSGVFVKGIDGMDEYQVEKIFAQHKPQAVTLVDESSCTLRWENAEEASEMLLDMTKAVQKIKSKEQLEEGEVEDSDEETSDAKRAEGSQSLAAASGSGPEGKKRRSANVAELNVNKIKIPVGSWRVVGKHVPADSHIFVRFATGFDIRRSIISPYQKPRTSIAARVTKRRSSQGSQDGEQFNWKSADRNKPRPGLNIFTDAGEELDWDYEHDTRFFVDTEKREASDKGAEEVPRKRKHSNAEETEEQLNDGGVLETVIAGKKIKSRGRGSKKGLFQLLTGSSRDEQAEDADQATTV